MFFVYDSTLRVPARALLAGPAARRARACAGSSAAIDLLATVLDLVGVPAPPTSGASRAAVLQPGGTHPGQRVVRREPVRPAPLRLRARCARCAARAGSSSTSRGRSSTGSPRTPARPGTWSTSGRRSPPRCGRSLQRFDRQSGSAPELPAVDEAAPSGWPPSATSGAGRPGRAALGGRPQGQDRRGAGLHARHARGDPPLPRARLRRGGPRRSGRAVGGTRRRSTSSTTSAAACSTSARFAEAIPHLRKAAEMAPTRRTLSGLAAAPIYALPRRGVRRGRASREGRDGDARAGAEGRARQRRAAAREGRAAPAAGRPRPRRARRSRRRARSTRASRASTRSSRTSTATWATSAGRGRGARGAAARPEVARRPPRQRPRAGRARARGRGGRGVPRGACGSRPTTRTRSSTSGRSSCARGAPRPRCRSSRSSRGCARLPAGPRDARGGAQDGRGARATASP